MKTILLAASLTFAGLAGTAGAATVDFTMDSTSQDGFNLSFRSVDGNCPGDAPCAALNVNQSDRLTYDGGTFDLLGLSFKLLGNANVNTFRIKAFQDGTNVFNGVYSVAEYLKKATHTLQLSILDVDSVRFSHSGGGNVRYDDLILDGTATPVPLPAAGLLLIGGLGGLALLRRRKTV